MITQTSAARPQNVCVGIKYRVPRIPNRTLADAKRQPMSGVSNADHEARKQAKRQFGNHKPSPEKKSPLVCILCTLL